MGSFCACMAVAPDLDLSEARRTLAYTQGRKSEVCTLIFYTLDP